MSAALAKAARLKPDIRLAQAISEFEADLSTEQKAVFRSCKERSCSSPPDIGDVMRLTAEIDRRVAEKSRVRRCFGPRLTNLLQAVQQYAALGDIVVGGSQNIIACSVWSLVRMSFLMLVEFSSYLDKLSSLLMVVGRSAPRYQKMALLYPQSRALQSHLSEYFIVVVRFCHQLFRFSQKSTLGQLTVPFSEASLKEYQSSFELWADMIKGEVELLMAQGVEELGGRLKAISALSKSELHRKQLKAYHRILDSFSTYDHQRTWKELRKAGQATLFHTVPRYQDWKIQVDAATLVCTGKLGCGKSVLLASIIDDLHLQPERLPVAYFFCRHDILESRMARTILGSLCRQLLQTVQPAIVVQCFGNASLSTLDWEEQRRLLQEALPPMQRAYIVVDGLDECDNDQSQSVIQSLQQLQRTLPLLVCLSFTLEADRALEFPWEGFINYNQFSIPDDNPDIPKFINHELESRIEAGRLKLGDPTLALEIRDALLDGAQGMFLWAALQLETLCDAVTDEAIRQELENLPKSLPETFSRILDKSENKHYQRTTLELVTTACRPLTAEELREALSVVPGDTTWNPARLLHDVYSILSHCGSLLVTDEETFTVKLAHHSVKKFLFTGLGSSTGPLLDVERANRTMRDIVLTYLNYGIFDTQLSNTVVPQIPTRGLPSTIIRSTLGASSTAQLALRLLRTPKQSNDIGNVLADLSGRLSTQSTSQFHFLNYAKPYWLHHCRNVSVQEPAIYRLLEQVVRRNIVDLSITTENGWTALVHAARQGNEAVVQLLLEKGAAIEAADNGGSTALVYAARQGHKAVVQALLEKGAATEAKSSEGLTALLYAADRGHEAVVQLLLEKGTELEAKDSEGLTALLYAARNGQETLVQLLLEKGAAIEAKDSNGLTALLYAARSGQETLVQLLLEKGAAIEAKDGEDLTALLYAASNGQEALVQILLEKGAAVEAKDGEGLTALLYAAMNGQEAVVQLLLENGAAIEAESSDGWTALLYAARNGHEAIVRLLLEKGSAIEARSPESWTALLHAARNGHEAIVQLLLEKGAAIEAKSSLGWTALLHAASQGHEAVVQRLLEKGASTEAKSSTGWTALLHAASQGNEAVVQLLLEKGAAIEVAGNSGWTPLLYAADRGHQAILQLLLEKGAAIEAADKLGLTALLHAADRGHQAIVQLLLDKGAAIEAKSSDGRTALLYAANQGHLAIVQLLLEKGAAIEARCSEGRTALLYAANRGDQGIVQLLLEKGAAIEGKDSEGWTALLYAAYQGHQATVQLLLEKGAAIEARGNDGWTALLSAAYQGHEAIVQLLLENGSAIEAADTWGWTALLHVARQGHEAVVQLLLEKGAAIDAADNEGSTALLHATSARHDAVVRLLKSHGARQR